jgi:hypothetical protein
MYYFAGAEQIDPALAPRGFNPRFGAEKPENSPIRAEAEMTVETRPPVASGS